MVSLARPVVRFRPASKRSLSSPAITNVLIPRRSPLTVGPLIVPRRTTFSSDSAPLVVAVWARGVASARTAARAIGDESRMLPPNDPAARRRTWATAGLHCRARVMAGSTTAARSGAPRLSSGLTPNCRQHVEADLGKVVVGRDHGRHPQLAHDREAGAVRERQILITILDKELPRPLETVIFDTFPSQPATAIDLLPPCIRGCESKAKANQRQRLVDDEVRGDKNSTGLERRVTGGSACRMDRIGTVGARHPAACIDEHAVHRRYKIASWSTDVRPSSDEPTDRAR